ncbi:MAG TPA: hypothetical protein VFU07_03265 [Candidatus Lumbricidophila sp.]|nr:hypothetical protein [Candidatus Lumbricidophila sp.]
MLWQPPDEFLNFDRGEFRNQALANGINEIWDSDVNHRVLHALDKLRVPQRSLVDAGDDMIPPPKANPTTAPATVSLVSIPAAINFKPVAIFEMPHTVFTVPDTSRGLSKR